MPYFFVFGWCEMLEFLFEVVFSFARPLLAAVLGFFGYDPDWEPMDGRSAKGWRLGFDAIFCCALSAIVLLGLAAVAVGAVVLVWLLFHPSWW
jgi:hypothetical protein